jgi:hypothetical protein
MCTRMMPAGGYRTYTAVCHDTISTAAPYGINNNSTDAH